jgi:PPOX class probable F420-dependent enzyme
VSDVPGAFGFVATLCDVRPTIRRLSRPEIEELLAFDIPAHLATIDADGYPRITPIWFVWEDGAFVMTSVAGRPHLNNLARDPRAAISIDTEDPRPVGGRRHNRRIRAQGIAELMPDDGNWTRRITRKYVPGADGEAAAERRASTQRVAIRLRPTRFIAQGSP